MVYELVAEKDGEMDGRWDQRCPAGKAQSLVSLKAVKSDGRLVD